MSVLMSTPSICFFMVLLGVSRALLYVALFLLVMGADRG